VHCQPLSSPRASQSCEIGFLLTFPFSVHGVVSWNSHARGKSKRFTLLIANWVDIPRSHSHLSFFWPGSRFKLQTHFPRILGSQIDPAHWGPWHDYLLLRLTLMIWASICPVHHGIHPPAHPYCNLTGWTATLPTGPKLGTPGSTWIGQTERMCRF
jgi:hypothetical protein